jgi:chromosome partitioning protein
VLPFWAGKPKTRQKRITMAKKICVANQKGGVGKTTTIINLGTSVALQNKKTLIVDVDPQANAGSGMNVVSETDNSIYGALVLDQDLGTIIKKTEVPNLFFAASTIDLTGAEIELVNLPEREFRLKKSLVSIQDQFDYIFIYCPPSLGLLTLNALAAADSVLIPLQCEYYALEGLSQLLKTIKLVKNGLNPDLVLEGIVLTMFDKRNRLSHQVAAEIMQHFPDKVFKAIIPRNVRLAECPSHRKPVYFYDRASIGSQRYLELARELLGLEPEPDPDKKEATS